MLKCLFSLWLILVANNACAQTDQLLAIQDFSPGLNMSVLPDIAPPGTFTTLQNWIMTRQGRLQKRWGFTQATAVINSSNVAGVTWTSRTSAADNDWFGVTYGNGMFVAVAQSGAGNRVMTSPDGITWTARTSAEDNTWQDVTYGGGLFVAVASTGTNRVMTSPDGITWTKRTAASASSWRGVAYGASTYVAIGSSGAVMTSPDGITWTSRTSASSSGWLDITYGNSLFVVVGRQTGDATQGVMTSTDGITWTNRTSAADDFWVDVAYGGGVYVAVCNTGGANGVMSSSDATTWTLRTPATVATWLSVTYGNSTFVAVGSSGSGTRVMTSSDGTTWTTRTSAANLTWNSVAYGAGVFASVASTGTGNRVMTSGGATSMDALYLWDQATAANPRIFSIDGSDSVRVTADTAWTTITKKLASSKYDFCPFNSKLIITGDADSAFIYTSGGTTLTAIASNAPDSARYCRNYKNYLWLANDGNTKRNRIWFSNLGDQTTFGANDYIDVYPYDGDQITGIEVFSEALMIFKERSVYALTGDAPTNFSVQQIFTGGGCHDHRTLRAVDGRLFFASMSAAYEMTSAGVERISDPLGDVFGETVGSSINPEGVFGSAILPQHKQYWIAVPVNSVQSNRLYVYNYEKKAWSEFTETFFSSDTDFVSYAITSGSQLGAQPTKPVVYIANTSDDRVYRYPYESAVGDHGASSDYAITSTATLAPLQGAMPHMMKQWRYLYMTAITTAADTISVSGINTTQTYTMSSGTNRFRVPLDTRSKALGVTITHATRAVADLGNFLFTYTLQQFEQ